ncbi:uncharacterized protein C8Q71DRAFT_777211 [Rhodofomes roseus]|uniref:Uncharacterized protein n=1 Tax=Rhodofomes roseus TaxID=34475 RepID=A0ABQ8K737_9APHY|nr:uncharacterized protein C8Q71DRAFT_777211 [Rhodofomes roseus]KAH9832587.1 hypothetical protein C8Q71DRAFT_777211 [Rhodofomes roseus]
MPPSVDHDDSHGATSSRFLSAGSSTPRKSPSRQSLSLNGRKSSTSLRAGSSLADALGDEGATGRHSLAHELAVALMPEPSAGSMLLAEEFGIEYDEGAEGIDEPPEGANEYDGAGQSLQDELTPEADREEVEQAAPQFAEAEPAEVDPALTSPTSPRQKRQPEQDPMVILAQDLEYTEKFLAQLRRLESDHANIEGLASDMIRRINDTTRDREEQVRELLVCEREFRKIAAEVNGTEVLGQLDVLEKMIDEPAPAPEPRRDLEPVNEDSFTSSAAASDWEVDPDRERLGDTEEDEYESAYSTTPVKATFPPPPPLNGTPTPANTITHLAYLRTFTTAAVSSLATISEHTQVNAAATTDAGRKIRALKNKLTEWRTEWDSAERSRVKIEQWESGIEIGTPNEETPRSYRRVDGRKFVQEHLQAFEKALAEANQKTQQIMAAAA